ncbi:MFS transporter [Rhodoplanes elegans]|uniref:MFS transporter n=1 Tax=Rhodoplanes elegans TaxID=29408 RepID=A0A327KLB5_9BRAD|nr:MFS transporter [Rhodoplanes elegans]MBK5959614.1 MFS transporter [Rhodoplanes elegans]RAI39297.1 MFS transporter [Rhodoplanes elegans]
MTIETGTAARATRAATGGLPVKWRVLISGFMSYAFDALDFMILAMSLPLIIKELDITMADAGLLGTATLLGVGISSVAMGWFADNYGRKTALMVGIAIFGLFTAAIGLAQGYYSIMVLRFIAGLGLGGIWGVIAAYISETWPSHQSGRAASFVFSSWPIGFGSAALLAGFILPRYGWRVLFFCGAVALVAVAYTYFFVPESETWKKAKAEREAGGGAKASVGIGEIFAPEVLRYTIVGTLSASFALIAYWGVNTWVPTFLVKERGMAIGDMSMFIVMLNVGMFLGYQLFGFLADKIGGKNALILNFIGATIMVPIYAFAESTTLLFWLGPVMALFFSYAGIFGSYFAKLYPLRIRSLGSGFCFDVGRGISAFAPFLLGQIAAHYSLAVGISLCGASFALAGLMVLLLPDTRKRAVED